MSILKSGKAWPYAIGIAITFVFFLGVGTIIVTSKADTQISDDYMTNYQDVDAKANDLIKARIAFDKKYKLKYVTEQIVKDGCDVTYKLTTLDGKAVPGAKMVLAVSRPETEQYSKKMDNALFENGVYVFKDVTFPKEGVWNLLLKVSVNGMSRFYPLKTDTRIKHDRSITEASTY